MHAWPGSIVLLLTLASFGPPVLADQTAAAGPPAHARREESTETDLAEEFGRMREALRTSPQLKQNDAESHFRLALLPEGRGPRRLYRHGGPWRAPVCFEAPFPSDPVGGRSSVVLTMMRFGFL